MSAPFDPRHELEGIVRKLSSKKSLKHQSGGKSIICFDESKGLVVNNTYPFRKYRYYLVYSSKPLKSEITDVEVEDFSSMTSVFLDIKYKAVCPPENMGKLIQALFNGNGEYPKSRLEELIKATIEEYVDSCESTSEFLNTFLQRNEQLSKYVKKKVFDLTGLKLESRINLQEELNQDLELIDIKEEEYLDIFVSDYDRALKLKYRVQLGIHPEYKLNALINKNNVDHIILKVRKLVKRKLAEQALLKDFVENKDKIKKIIYDSIDRELIAEGRQISKLLIETESIISEKEKEFILEDHVLDCLLKDSSIKVTHRLIMNIQDYGKYKSSSVQDLEKWVKAKLESVTKHALFGRTYLDLIKASQENTTTRNPFEEIKIIMTQEAEKIGFEVKLHIAVPKEKPLELLQGFNFEVEDKFSTRNIKIEAELNLSVRGRITDLNKIEKYIKPDVDIINKMKEKTIDGVKRVIDNVEPERYYIRFKIKDERQGDKQTVEEEIIDSVKKVLQEDFSVTDLVIIPRVLSTDITRRFERLHSKFYEFTFETFPFSEAGYGEKISIKLKYQILGVHPEGWYQFQSKQFSSIEEEVDQISDLLKSHLQNILSTVKSGSIMYTKHEDIKKLQKIANSVLPPIIKNTFGLIIQIVFIGRKATNIEEIMQSRRIKQIEIEEKKNAIEGEASLEIAKIQKNELQSLIEQYTRYQNVPELADSDEAVAIKKKIDEYNSQFDEINNSVVENVTARFADSDESNTLEGLLSIIEGNNQKQLNSSSESPSEEPKAIKDSQSEQAESNEPDSFEDVEILD